MMKQCTHLNQMQVTSTDIHVCEDCVKTGDSWVHLRLCLSCGRVGCCDSSKNKHATKHFRSTQHPLIRSIEPGENWVCCYAGPDRTHAYQTHPHVVVAGATSRWAHASRDRSASATVPANCTQWRRTGGRSSLRIPQKAAVTVLKTRSQQPFFNSTLVAFNGLLLSRFSIWCGGPTGRKMTAPSSLWPPSTGAAPGEYSFMWAADR